MCTLRLYQVRMSGSGNKKSGARRSEDDSSSEVEDLLRAAEDQLLINLRLNSHTAKSQSPFSPSPSSSSSYLDSDLARCFDALKSPSNPKRNPNPSESLKQSQEKEIAAYGESAGIVGDDLAARFAALKGSIGPAPAPSPSPPASLGFEKHQVFKDSCSKDDDDGDGVSKKEVEKLMDWAKDAARLHPSKKSDDSDEDENEEEEEEDDDSDDSEEERRKRKEKSKGKPKRWIFF